MRSHCASDQEGHKSRASLGEALLQHGEDGRAHLRKQLNSR